MATANEIIKGALRKLGVVATGESLTSSEQQDGLTALNEMIESFSNENLFVFDDNEETFTLTTSKSSYTMGSGGDFDTTRPIKIHHARLQVNSSTPSYELPISLLELDEWTKIVQKNVSSSVQTAIYVDYGYPLATINVYPVPSYANSLILNSLKIVQSFSSATDNVSLPPGYNRLLTYNLAIEMAPEFGVEPSPSVQKIAMQSKANVKRANKRVPIMKSEMASLMNGANFNWLTGD